MAIDRSILLCFFCICVGCNYNSSSFDREISLVIRATHGELTDHEKHKLLSENHPVLLQLSDPAIRDLLKLFADLPEDHHTELRTRKFLKWRFDELDVARQQVFTNVLTMNMKMVYGDSFGQGASRVLKLLGKSEIGFAVVDIPSNQEKVVSCFVLWPDRLAPTWVGVANARALRANDADEAHVMRLPMLKNFSTSKLPPAWIETPGGEEIPQQVPTKKLRPPLFTRAY